MPQRLDSLKKLNITVEARHLQAMNHHADCDRVNYSQQIRAALDLAYPYSSDSNKKVD
jgi:hypothetical protein